MFIINTCFWMPRSLSDIASFTEAKNFDDLYLLFKLGTGSIIAFLKLVLKQ